MSPASLELTHISESAFGYLPCSLTLMSPQGNAAPFLQWLLPSPLGALPCLTGRWPPFISLGNTWADVSCQGSWLDAEPQCLGVWAHEGQRGPAADSPCSEHQAPRLVGAPSWKRL